MGVGGKKKNKKTGRALKTRNSLTVTVFFFVYASFWRRNRLTMAGRGAGWKGVPVTAAAAAGVVNSHSQRFFAMKLIQIPGDGSKQI